MRGEQNQQLIINTSYQYEDIDIQAILTSRLQQIFTRESSNQQFIVLAAVDNIVGNQLEQRLHEESRDHNGKRIVLIPCNLGGSHWVGILLEFQEDGQIKRAEYIDSLNNLGGIPDKLQMQINNVYQNCVLQQQILLKQKDITSCGAYVIENLLLSAQNLPVTPKTAEEIRILHLQCLCEYREDFYEGFYTRQRDNVPTTIDFHRQLGYLEKLKGVYFSKQELGRILDIKQCINKITNEKLRINLLKAFQNKEQDKDNIKLHLDIIRQALQQAITDINDEGFIEDKELLKNLIKLLYDFEWQPGQALNLSTLDFSLGYNEIIAVTQSKTDSAADINEIQEQIREQIQKDEEFARRLQAELWREQLEDGNKATDSKVSLPTTARCGLCENPLKFNGPTVTCDYDEDDNNFSAEYMRDFHKECLTDYFDKYVLAPNSNNNMKTTYTPVKKEEVTEEMVCPLSKRRGREIIRPVKAGDGRIYQEDDLIDYIKNGKILLWDRIIVSKRLKALSFKEMIKIQSLLKICIASKNFLIPEEQDDTFKTLMILNDLITHLFSGGKSRFDEFQSRQLLRTQYDVVVDDKGKFTFKFKSVTQTKSQEQDKLKAQKIYENSIKNMNPHALNLAIQTLTDTCYCERFSPWQTMETPPTSMPFVLSSIPVLIITQSLTSLAIKKAKDFTKAILEATKLYYEDFLYENHFKLEQAEKILKAEFGEGDSGRYQFSRAARWSMITSNQFAFAHLLLAKIGFKLNRKYTYNEFDQAFHDAIDTNLKGIALLDTIKMLSPNSKGPVPTIEERNLTIQEREKLLKEKVKKFYNNYQNIIKRQLSPINGLCQHLLKNIQRDDLLESRKQIIDFMNLENIHFMRYMKPHGKLCEVIFTFMQGLYLIMLKEYDIKINLQLNMPNFDSSRLEFSENQIKLISLARLKLEKCWALVNTLKMTHIAHYNSVPGVILNEIKHFIRRFFERCKKEKIFADDLDNRMVELGLVKKSHLSEDQILKIVKHATKTNASHNNLMLLQRILSKILTSEKFARSKFKGGRTWLHLLPKIENRQLVEAVKKATEYVISLGISPYERTNDGKTAFMCIPSSDLNKMFDIFRRGNGKLPSFIGLEKQIASIERFLKFSQEKPATAPHFLLLSGPPGTGKTELIKQLAKKSGFELREFVRGTQNDMWLGQLSLRVQDFFKSAKQSEKPVCLFLDEIDSICPEYQGTPMAGHYNPDQLVTLIQTEIDKLKGTKTVLIGATNYLSNVKPAIRNRAGMPVVFGLPNMIDRKKILEYQLRMIELSDADIIVRIAEATSGWSPRLLIQYINNVINKAEGENRSILVQDFIELFEPMRESLRDECLRKRNIDVEPPKLQLNIGTSTYESTDYVGISPKVKQQLDGVCLFLKKPEAYTTRLTDIHKNLLLYGPPGTGKTSFARAVANNAGALFINIEGGNYKTPGSQILLADTFDFARGYEKAIIFIDEIDAISGNYSPARETLQTAIDGFKRHQNTLVIIGATNHLKNISEAILSRFKQIEIPLPNENQRFEAFKLHIGKIRNMQIETDDLVSMCSLLAKESEGFSQRDIAEVVKDAVSETTDMEQQRGTHVPLTYKIIFSKLQSKKEEVRARMKSCKKGKRVVF